MLRHLSTHEKPQEKMSELRRLEADTQGLLDPSDSGPLLDLFQGSNPCEGVEVGTRGEPLGFQALR